MNVNIGYAWGQLMRARQTLPAHPDVDVRARAQETVAKWEAVIAGVQAGTIDVGSRRPTKAPAWVTLDVVTGGFATGGYSAGGPLRDDERALAETLGVPASRAALNVHFLTSTDAAALLDSGRYRIDVPEEGALLVVAWLRARGEIGLLLSRWPRCCSLRWRSQQVRSPRIRRSHQPSRSNRSALMTSSTGPRSRSVRHPSFLMSDANRTSGAR